jgi:hypothetical protein
LYKGRLYEEAELEIFRFLGSRELCDFANQQLRELLDVVIDERLVVHDLKQRYSGDVVTVSLRGGEIGFGTGPLDVILSKAAAFRSLTYRVAEWLARHPFRTRGNPSSELLSALQIRAGQATAGSYRLDMRLAEPSQQRMFETPYPRAEAVSDVLFEFLERVTRGSPEDVENLVPDPAYRRALLELTKSVAPGGKRVDEVNFHRYTRDRLQTVYLTPAVSIKVRAALPRRAEGERLTIEVKGVLRALHLDANWLELSLGDGPNERCDTVDDLLDDVVGPMVNHEVLVRGVKRRKQGGIERVLVSEIELVEPD